MRQARASVIILAGLFWWMTGAGAEPLLGPVISEYGPVFPVPPGSFNLERGVEYRVIMDIAGAPADLASVNPDIESAARFLNMHARHGIEPGNVKLALVLHGAAASAALNDAEHRKHHGVANGSKGLLEALATAGVRIFLCGQSAGHRGYSPGEFLPQVSMAVSAMTAHVRLQEEGYRAILF